MRRPIQLAIAIAHCFALAGCASAPALLNAPLLGQQLQKQDTELIGQHFRTMLDFENDADAAFVNGGTGPAAGHTGQRGLTTLSGTTINISSLLFGLTLPADWSLLGAYVRPDASGIVTTTLFADGRPVAKSVRTVPRGVWAFAAIDLTARDCRILLPAAKSVSLRIDAPGGLAMDDVMLVDNRRTLVQVERGWTVSQAGLSLAVTWPGRAPLLIPSVAASPDGWALIEANAVRVRLQDGTGHGHWTLVADGRSVVDGRLSDPETLTAYATPAQAVLDESTGHLDRETPGDDNNDGFNEQRGAYQITANGPRLRLRLIPHADSPMTSPVLEIHGLPAEAHVVIVDGRLMDQTARLADGTLLVLLPLRVETPIEVTIGVAQ